MACRMVLQAHTQEQRPAPVAPPPGPGLGQQATKSAAAAHGQGARELLEDPVFQVPGEGPCGWAGAPGRLNSTSSVTYIGQFCCDSG